MRLYNFLIQFLIQPCVGHSTFNSMQNEENEQVWNNLERVKIRKQTSLND